MQTVIKALIIIGNIILLAVSYMVYLAKSTVADFNEFLEHLEYCANCRAKYLHGEGI